MGCDIHMYVERKVGNTWEQVYEEDGKYPDRKSWDPDRNYDLFGLLAGIRSTIFSPLIPPRGIPEDLSKSVNVEWEKYEGYGHTPSFLTLAELLPFEDSAQDVPCYLDISGFKSFKKTGKVPNNYYYSYPLSYKSCVVSNEEMGKIINLVAFLDDKQYWTKIEHKEQFKEISKVFFVDIIGAMKKLSKNPEDIRCVFWFDS